MRHLATKQHNEKMNQLKFGVWTPLACDVNKLAFTKLASPIEMQPQCVVQL